jgi:hypothetical protein
MGYFGLLNEKLIAQKLRKRGLSYKEILQSVHVSKDTISRWCKDIPLTEQQKQRLISNKRFGQHKGSIIAAENKRIARDKKIIRIYKDSRKQLGKLSKKNKFFAGVALYAAEGDKTDGKGGFANSDPKLIKFMMEWFRQYCDLPLSKFRGAIWLHEGLSERKAKKYWSDLTGIPETQFHKTFIAENKINSNKIRKNIHSYGIFSIRFSDSDKHRRIMGWISALFDDIISSVH